MTQHGRFHVGKDTPAPHEPYRTITVRIPLSLYEVVRDTVDASGMTLDHVITTALQIAFTAPDEIKDL